MNITNITSNVLAVASSAGAFAATAAVVGSPIGAVGGAIYGTCIGTGMVITTQFCDKTLDGRIKFNAKLAFAGIASFFAAWKLSSLAGAGLSLKAAVSLNVASTVLGGLALVTVVTTAIALRLLVKGITAGVNYARA